MGRKSSVPDVEMNGHSSPAVEEDPAARAARKAAKKAAKKAAAEAEARNGAASLLDQESTLRDGKPLHQANGINGHHANGSSTEKEAKKEKKSKKRKAEDDVQAPEEEEAAMNSKKSKTATSDDPTEQPDAQGNPPLKSFNVSPSTIQALAANNITHMFPIQAATFDLIHEGQDVVGRARTGTGKTLAFSLPIVERLLGSGSSTERLPFGRAPRVIVLTPTRELALQIQKTFDMIKGNKLQTLCVYGGSPYGPQEGALRRGVDITIGTCGRIKDLLEKGTLRLDKVEYVILDEADEMLAMGFADEVETILSNVPRKDSAAGHTVQTLLFSATIPSWVEGVARKYLRPDRKQIDLVGNSQQHANTDISHLAMACHWSERNSVLGEVISVYGGDKARVIIFTETKKEANELLIEPSIKGTAAALHGDIPQAQRESTLRGFRDGKFRILIATDVAARGLDIAGVELVIQVEPPEKAEDYIHRSGRTGRAGKKGVCITFYTPKQLYYIQNIETRAKVKFQRVPIPQATDMIKRSVEPTVEAVQAVSSKMVPYFLESAQRMLKDGEESGKDAATILAAALAKVAGYSEAPKQRSLLTSATGMITCCVRMQQTEVRSLSFVWGLIRRYLVEDGADEKVKGMRMLRDRTGACFDVPAELEETIRNLQPNDRRVSFEVPETLPELQQIDVPPPQPKWRGGNDRRNGGGFGGRNGGGGGGGFSRGGRAGGRGRR